MLSATFRLFEVVCGELTRRDSIVMTREDFGHTDQDAPIIDELEDEYHREDSAGAIADAVVSLKEHFSSRGSSLPFEYDTTTGRFTAIDKDYINFVDLMHCHRGIGQRARDFELQVSRRLSNRLPGLIHKVGWPRLRTKKLNAFRRHLKPLGFSNGVVFGSEKDGGFDILWLPPLGVIPHRLVVSVQCKNSHFSLEEADTSLGAAQRSFSAHRGLQPSVNVMGVLFNDYITPDDIPPKQMNFLPLGLSDLSPQLGFSKLEQL